MARTTIRTVLDIVKIRNLLNWMQSIELGPGDLSTESISPYALHSEGLIQAQSTGLFCGRNVLELLFEESGKQINIDWKISDGDSIEPGDTIFTFNGKGADILKNRRLIRWIIGRMSGLAGDVQRAVQFLKSNGKELVEGISVVPIFEVLDEIAFETGGGYWVRHGLTDSIYITRAHIHYAGGIDACLRQLNDEIGDVRKTVKIEIEVNTAAQFEQLNELDYDKLHLVNFSEEDIRVVFEKLNPVKKPILHLATLKDFKNAYVDYFFKYCAIEELHRNFSFLDTSLIFSH